jgi:hypothetical protein
MEDWKSLEVLKEDSFGAIERGSWRGEEAILRRATGALLPGSGMAARLLMRREAMEFLAWSLCWLNRVGVQSSAVGQPANPCTLSSGFRETFSNSSARSPQLAMHLVCAIMICTKSPMCSSLPMDSLGLWIFS